MALCVHVPCFAATAQRQAPPPVIHSQGSDIHCCRLLFALVFRNTFPVTFEFYQCLGHYNFLGKLFPSTDLWALTESEIPCRFLRPPWGPRASSGWGSAPAAAPPLGFYSSDAHRFSGLMSWLRRSLSSVVVSLCSCPSGPRMLLLRR